jgi:hypothetical protein
MNYKNGCLLAVEELISRYQKIYEELETFGTRYEKLPQKLKQMVYGIGNIDYCPLCQIYFKRDSYESGLTCSGCPESYEGQQNCKIGNLSKAKRLYVEVNGLGEYTRRFMEELEARWMYWEKYREMLIHADEMHFEPKEVA